MHTAKLSPDTEEKMVIVTTSADALDLLATGDAVQLRHPGARDVTFVPVGRESVPVLDPKLGWIIPVTPATADEIAALPKGPGNTSCTRCTWASSWFRPARSNSSTLPKE